MDLDYVVGKIRDTLAVVGVFSFSIFAIFYWTGK